MSSSNISHDEINRLEQQVYNVVIKKLKEDNLPYEVKVRVYDNVKTTGVQGDDRTYCPLVEITLIEEEKIVWDEKFTFQISTEIVNNVMGTNRVIMTIPINK